MGFTFKENCNDIRNTKIYDLYLYLINKKINVNVHDPVASDKEAKNIYNINLYSLNNKDKFDCIILAVKHKYYLKIGKKNILSYGKKDCFFLDLKKCFE